LGVFDVGPKTQDVTLSLTKASKKRLVHDIDSPIEEESPAEADFLNTKSTMIPIIEQTLPPTKQKRKQRKRKNGSR
jgi:hypothetical protein